LSGRGHTFANDVSSRRLNMVAALDVWEHARCSPQKNFYPA
jgi:hypothetical protein